MSQQNAAGPDLPALWRRLRRAAFVGAAFVASACSNDGSEIVLRLAHDQTEAHPYHLAAVRFAERVEEATQGAVQVRIFPAAQLGDSPEQVEGLHLGTLDLAIAAFSHASQFCPELGLFGASFLFEDDEHFATVFDGEVGDILDRACHQRYSVRLLSTLTSGPRLLFNGRRPVDSAADLRGLKIRVMGGEADALTWQAFGALPVPMPYSEVYSALQAGVIDGAENEPVSVLSNRFYEPAPYFALTDHLVLPMGLFISDRTLQGLPEPYPEILREQASETAVWQRDFVAQRNAAALAEMQERYGAEVSSLSSAELRGRGISIQDRVAETLGLGSLLEKVRAGAN